jgi:hypothetical protein
MCPGYLGTPVLADIPSTPDGEWCFGGVPYGLEPLTLPFPGQDTTPQTNDTPGLTLAWQSLRAGSVAGAQPCEQAEALYWFRWITGHQISFILWRMSGRLAEEARQRVQDPATVLAALASLVDGYSAMLLYSGSCPRSCYESLIRPSMRLRHPAFTGSWAPDYVPIRPLFRGRLGVLTDGPGSDGLLDALAANQIVHEHVAGKLVPDGVSLLRGAEPAARHQDRRVLHLIFDNYFLTLRGTVTLAEVLGQLIRRVTAVAQDIEANGGPPDDADEEVRRFTRDTVPILEELVERALSLSYPDGEGQAVPGALTSARAL